MQNSPRLRVGVLHYFGNSFQIVDVEQILIKQTLILFLLHDVSRLSSCLTSGSDERLCFQYMLAFDVLQHGHLLDSYLVQFLETLALW